MLKFLSKFTSKQKNESEVAVPIEMPPNVKFDMETILNDYWPLCTPEGKKKITQIATEHAQLNYGFLRDNDSSDINSIRHIFTLFSEIDSKEVRHRVHELTYSPKYFTLAGEYAKKRKEAANIIRGMFPENNMEPFIEDALPGYGDIQK